MATRWCIQDLSGRAIDRLNWPYINIPAIKDNGEALWPEQRPLSFLALQREADPFSFNAQYMGTPLELGSSLFNEPDRYTDFPINTKFTTAYGLDLAYSEKTIADWSVLVRGRKYKDTLYITNVIRKQVETTSFIKDIESQYKQQPGSLRWYFAGAEKGVLQFLRVAVPSLKGLSAKDDKVTRSTKCREAWNLKRILVPNIDSPYYGPWVETFVNELIHFTGAADAHDDQVDAVAALYDELYSGQIDWSTADEWQGQLGGLRMCK
jgi:predicted phage terminase large subunit-like protein